MKDLAKRFFLLLHVFLERRYKRVELVFIRHTEVAEEVDEETFFTDPRTGGTVVSTALAEFIRIQRERYPAGFLEHLRRPGVGRRQLRQRHAAGGGDAGEPTSCRSCSTSPISRSRRRPRSIRGETDLWRGYDAAGAARSRSSRCAGWRSGGTSSRCSATCSPARTAAGMSAVDGEAHGRVLLYPAAPTGTSSTLRRSYDAIERIADEELGLEVYPEPHRGDHRPSRCSTSTPRTACR